MKKIIGITYFALIITISSCATGYGPKGWQGGYTEMKLGEDIYKVAFHGNSSTESEEVYNYFLRRCADLTIIKGYEYFAFIDQSTTSQTNIGTVNNGSSSQFYSSTEHSKIGIIKMYKNGDQPKISFSAKEVLANFRK